MHERLILKGMCLESRDLFNLWKISDNMLAMVQDRDVVALEN